MNKRDRPRLERSRHASRRAGGLWHSAYAFPIGLLMFAAFMAYYRPFSSVSPILNPSVSLTPSRCLATSRDAHLASRTSSSVISNLYTAYPYGLDGPTHNT